MKELNGAQMTVECLKAQNVKHILAIPGAKIDGVFNALVDSGPEVIVCRHEQNAAFAAAAIGRLTGKPGVVLVTSGPGTSNLATGLITATTEGDPIVAIAGAVSLNEEAKRTHQSMQAVALMTPITKYSIQVQSVDNVAEILNNAFRIASEPRAGATFVAIPQDIQANKTEYSPLAIQQPRYGAASRDDINKAIKKLSQAKLPVIFIGQGASEPRAAAAIRNLLSKTNFPVVGTFQAAGVIPRSLVNCFAGRVGLFRNQPGDILLSMAEVILTIGYDPVEYDPEFWNPDNNATIIHLNQIISDIDNHYQPEIELLGDIADSVDLIASELAPRNIVELPTALPLIEQFALQISNTPSNRNQLVHPIYFVQTLRKLIGDDVTVTVDMGSNYIYMVRHFLSFEPRRLLVSNGQQTLGVGLPWGIGACLVNPHEKVISISGDGGFLFSAMELETAVRLKANLVHFVWKDGTYNMVAFQEQLKYGRTSGTDFGPIDTVKHAESYGAVGLRVTSPIELEDVIKKALEIPGPVVVEIPIDYSENLELAKKLHPGIFH